MAATPTVLQPLAEDSADQRLRLRSGLEWAAHQAYAPGEYVGQEGFVTASDALALVRAAGVSRGSRLLDLCCGMGAMGLYLAGQLVVRHRQLAGYGKADACAAARD